MNLTFLGTGAANAFPEAFCSCQNCQQARALGGPSLRRRSAALIDNELLIDLGPDIMSASNQHNLPLTRVRYCLQTHPHADHLDTSHFLSRSPEYGTQGAPRLHFYASRATLQAAAKLLERDCAPHSFLDAESAERWNVSLHPIEAFQPFQAGRYRVIPFPASHDPEMESLLYAIQGDGRTIFYGTDTAALSETVWEGFHHFKLRFDLVILDHTYGPEEPGGDHLSARQLIEHAVRMREEGLLTEGARILGTHIAHEGNPAHPVLAEFAARHGYEIAYDGMTL
jgi:phosphoribosyl 1,2-cyclic phosphate phosphodiesterase